MELYINANPSIHQQPQRYHVNKEDLSGTTFLSPPCLHYSVLYVRQAAFAAYPQPYSRLAVFHIPLDTRRFYIALLSLESISR